MKLIKCIGSAFAVWHFAAVSSVFAATEAPPAVDYLSFAQGAMPIVIQGGAQPLKVGMEQALKVIDGDKRGFNLTPKPGDDSTQIEFIYKLPALTTFSEFVVPNVLETPSPSQTFVGHIDVAGSDQGQDGPFVSLSSADLQSHTGKGQLTKLSMAEAMPVQWVRVSFRGGINVIRDKTFFEFSELIGYGEQQAVPMSEQFSGKWKGRGVLLELKQDGATVSGCYDRVGDIEGSVSGNLLSATGKNRKSGVVSAFLLAVTDDGQINGLRSTNGAPFRLYRGESAPKLKTECSERVSEPLGCSSILHGIQFDFNSAKIRAESHSLLDALYDGLAQPELGQITIVGHTSSEGAESYNQRLSEQRAQAVVAALVGRGLASERIAAMGSGETQPIADNETGAGRALNRRVEVQCR